MQRCRATIIAIVGEQAGLAARTLGRAANVRSVVPDAAQPPLDRAVAALRGAAGRSAPFVVHDADPLADVAEAWVRHYDGDGVPGALELAVQAVLTRWKGESVELPDYYLLLDPGEWPATRRHWYLGFLHRAAPSRVVPTTRSAAALSTAVSGLRAGRWWPPLDRLLGDVERLAPDAVTVGAPSAEAAEHGDER